jgi:hypothetical protein
MPILPLPISNRYHSNRPDLLFPTTPLPPCHCHSSSHCHSQTHNVSLFFQKKSIKKSKIQTYLQTTVSPSILPLPISNRYHSNRLDVLYPTVPLSNNHCHSPSRGLMRNIVLSGGSTTFKDFARRLNRDVKRLSDARLKKSEEVACGLWRFYSGFWGFGWCFFGVFDHFLGVLGCF